MIAVYFRGDSKPSTHVPALYADEWVELDLARWKGPSRLELKCKRGAFFPETFKPDLSIRMPPSEIIKAAQGHPPSVARFQRYKFGFPGLFLDASEQRVLDRILDGIF